MRPPPHRIIAIALVAAAGWVGWSHMSAPDADSGPDQPALIAAAGLTATLLDPTAQEIAGMTPLPLTVIGQTTPSPQTSGSLRHDWPAIYATGQFTGSTVALHFDDAQNSYEIRIDGAAAPSLTLHQPGRRVLWITGLDAGPHRIRLDKISEGAAQFGPVLVPSADQAGPPPPPRQRRILFIGDSDTVGYGNMSAGRECTPSQVARQTNTRHAFGPIVARHFNADYTMIAQSGIGVVRNYGGDAPDATMLSHDLSAPSDAAPQVIVIALGSNDFATPLGADEHWTGPDALRVAFETGYRDLVQAQRAQHPAAFIILLAFADGGDTYLAAHDAVWTTLQPSGTAMAEIVVPALDRTGCHWHPSAQDHAMIANRLIARITQQPGLWPE